ncbi:unnamed protein product, partial [Ixodes pacificus]
VQSSVTDESIDLDSSQPRPKNARLSDLCRELEGRHRCCKATVDAVVHGVNSILVEHGVLLNTDYLASDRERKAHYTKAGIYVPPKQVTLSSGHNAYFVPLQNLLTNL